jgi:hypothetical protein
MATKCEEIARLSKKDGPLFKASEDEPIFVLRAQDKFFVPLVRLWIELVEMDAPDPPTEAVAQKVMEVVELANAAVIWQAQHKDRVKVPD